MTDWHSYLKSSIHLGGNGTTCAALCASMYFNVCIQLWTFLNQKGKIIMWRIWPPWQQFCFLLTALVAVSCPLPPSDSPTSPNNSAHPYPKAAAWKTCTFALWAFLFHQLRGQKAANNGDPGRIGGCGQWRYERGCKTTSLKMYIVYTHTHVHISSCLLIKLRQLKLVKH